MDTITTTAHADTSTKTLATLPTESARPYLYFLKAGNQGTVAQQLIIEHARHNNAYRDRTVIPAIGQTQSSGFPAVGENFVMGGDPERDKLLMFDAGGTINAFIAAAGGGSMPVTAGIAIP